MSKRANRQSAANDRSVSPRRLAVGYTRVSTLGQKEKGSSPEAQRTAIEAFCDAMEYTLIEIIDDDGTGVGAKSFYNRKRLQVALDLVVREEALLVVWDWDRLSRHANFEKQVQKVLPDANRIKCAKEGMSMQEASHAARFAHSEKVAQTISHNTKQGMAKKRAQGAIFGNPEIGTKVQPMGTATWANTRAEQDRALADILRKLPNQIELTRSQVAEIFNQNGLRTLHKKKWTRDRVTEPLKRARAIIQEEEVEKMASDPKFGMF